MTLSDDAGQTISQPLSPGSLTLVTTGWTQAATTITVSFTAGWALGLDDVTFQATLPIGVRGDLDGNGRVTLSDLRLQIQMLVGSIPSTPAAELTGDSQLTLADLRALIRILVGGP